MPTFSPQQLQESASGTWLGGRVPACGLSGFTQDSRLLKTGMCFVALQTAQRDGHAFVQAALEAGAAMALVSRGDENCALPQLVVADVLVAFQRIARAHRLSFGGKIVGVTGSCGKTSTKEILRTLLGQGCYATQGNLNNFIGVPLTLLGLETAPQFAVIEAGISEPGEMAVLTDMIRPDIAVVTMVGPAHLQDLGSVAGVAAEKAVLAHAVEVAGDSLAPVRLPLLFAPLECFAYPAFAALENEGVAVAAEGACGDGCATAPPALPAGIMLHRYRVESLADARDSAEAFLRIDGERLCDGFALGFVPSAGMASNLALALIAAHVLGVPVDLLAQRVRGWQPQGNRGSWKQLGAQRFFVDCYNANPASMQDSLTHFIDVLGAGAGSALKLSRLYVIGGMRELGDQSVSWHRRLGEFLGTTVVDAQRRDIVVSIGAPADNAGLEAGLREHAPSVPLHSFTQTQDAQALVAEFEGVVFLKGSRFYALESLLPKEPPA